MLIKTILIFALWIIICVITGWGEALRIKGVTEYSAAWHNLQWLERIGIGATLFLIGRFISMRFLPLIPTFLLLMITFFIIYDGMINIVAFERGFFFVSQTTTAWTEQFAHWWIKIPLVVIVFGVNVFLFNRLSKENENLFY